MRKKYDNDEKRIPEVVVDYSEELERIMDNPDLLVQEEYLDDRERDSVSDGSHHYSSSHHHRSSHQHHSRTSGYTSHSHRTHHRSNSGGGRLASHHRSRHHHKYNDSAEHKSIAPAVVDLVTSDASEYGNREGIEAKSEYILKEKQMDGTLHTDTENIDTTNQKDIVLKSEKESIERTRRIASKTSGSESSKREIERANESTRERKRRKKNNKHYYRKKKIGFIGVLARILLFFIVIGFVGVGTLVYLRYLGEKTMKKAADDVLLTVPETPDAEVDDGGKIIVYKGEKYCYNDDVSTILFMGTDRTLSQQENSETLIGANGQADTILVGVIDNKNKKISFLSINRDTMAPVAEYTVDDDYAGHKKMQICLAYSYGADNIQSCERMTTAVSEYLYGMPINAYCRLSYDGIPPLNDTIGGVQVKIPEDMTEANPSWAKGEKITLKGDEAITYVRWRNRGTVHTNELRMARQKQYLNNYIRQALTATRSDISLPITLFSTATDYMTTDITASKVTYLSSKALEYGITTDAIQTVPGESIDGEEHVEFYPDDKALFELILKLFYNKV